MPEATYTLVGYGEIQRVPASELPSLRDILKIHKDKIPTIAATLLRTNANMYPNQLIVGLKLTAKLIILSMCVDEDFIRGKNLAVFARDPTIMLLLGDPDK